MLLYNDNQKVRVVRENEVFNFVGLYYPRSWKLRISYFPFAQVAENCYFA